MLVSFVNQLKSRKVQAIIILFYLSFLIFGVFYGPSYLSKTKLTMTSPPHSYSAHANDVLLENFPQLHNQSTGIVLITSNDPSIAPNILNNTAVKSFEKDLLSSLFTNVSHPTHNCFDSFDSYFKRLKAGELAEAKKFITTKEDAMMEIFTLTIDCDQENLQNFAQNIMQKAKFYSNEHLKPIGLVARVTGIDAFLVDVLHGIEHDIALMDAVAFPLALAILMTVLQSGRLLILPITCMIFSILGSFTIMRPIAEHVSVITFAPSVQMSLSIALSIDYSLFLLGRYREELQKKPDDHDGAVTQMLRHAGHVVFVSNITLTLCFLGNLFFSSILLATIGIAAATTCLCSLVVNVTLVPTLLLTFPFFFRKSIEPGVCCCDCTRKTTVDRSYSLSSDSGTNYTILHPEMHNDGNSDDNNKERKSCWYSCAVNVVHLHKCIILLTLLLASPFAWRISQGFRHSTSLVQLVPRGVDSTIAYNDLGKYFGVGISNPYRIIIIAPEGQAIIDGKQSHYTLNEKFCNITRNVLKNYIGKTRAIDQMNVTAEIGSLSYVSGLKKDVNLCQPIPSLGNSNLAELCSELKWSKEVQMNGASCADVKSLYSRYNVSSRNKNKPATFADLAISIDPNTPAGGVWYEELLNDIQLAHQEISGMHGYQFIVSSLAAAQYETNQHAFEIFPMAVCITAGVVFILIGIAFRSIIIPLRAVFSISLTIVLVYGAAIFVYEDGILAFLNFNGLMPLKDDQSLCWIPPILSFSVVVGLGLDYDVFLLSRIVEARENKDDGYDDRLAIKVGLTKTGGIITAAGCIMATAFSGLLFSAEPVLNQISFFLVFAVLTDTFLIRALFVPSLMVLLSGRNWWPRKMPTVMVTKNIDDDEKMSMRDSN
jgi:RND superfamily putative drug exporter